MSRILVTGANGFVGAALLPVLKAAGHRVRAALWQPDPALPDGVVVGDIGPATEWGAALDGVDAIIHLAARVHVMRETEADPPGAFRRVNVEGTRRLAEAAQAAGVRRLVLMSTVKVNGERTKPGRPFTEADPPAPEDAYGVSKLEAERALEGAVAEPVVLRAPLVYGPGVRANFLALMKACARGLPLPLGAVRNARSLLFVGNLADALLACATHAGAAGETFLVRDGEDVSTGELARRVGAAVGRRVPLVPVPAGLLRAAAAAVGKSAAAARLLDSLVVDDGKLRRTLEWAPPFTLDAGLRRTAAWFQASRNRRPNP